MTRLFLALLALPLLACHSSRPLSVEALVRISQDQVAAYSQAEVEELREGRTRSLQQSFDARALRLTTTSDLAPADCAAVLADTPKRAGLAVAGPEPVNPPEHCIGDAARCEVEIRQALAHGAWQRAAWRAEDVWGRKAGLCRQVVAEAGR